MFAFEFFINIYYYSLHIRYKSYIHYQREIKILIKSLGTFGVMCVDHFKNILLQMSVAVVVIKRFTCRIVGIWSNIQDG